LRAVLAHDFNPGLCQNLHVLDGDVLRRDDDGDAGTDLRLDPLVIRADVIR
jgi:hypothetical protein